MDDKIIQKILMDEELVQNGVMRRKFVKNFVMDAKIDPKVVIDLSVFTIGGWNILQPVNRKLLKECIEENDSQLLSIKILSGDLFLTIQYLDRQLMDDDPNVKCQHDHPQFITSVHIWSSCLTARTCLQPCRVHLIILHRARFGSSRI